MEEMPAAVSRFCRRAQRPVPFNSFTSFDKLANRRSVCVREHNNDDGLVLLITTGRQEDYSWCQRKQRTPPREEKPPKWCHFDEKDLILRLMMRFKGAFVLC